MKNSFGNEETLVKLLSEFNEKVQKKYFLDKRPQEEFLIEQIETASRFRFLKSSSDAFIQARASKFNKDEMPKEMIFKLAESYAEMQIRNPEELKIRECLPSIDELPDIKQIKEQVPSVWALYQKNNP